MVLALGGDKTDTVAESSDLDTNVSGCGVIGSCDGIGSDRGCDRGSDIAFDSDTMGSFWTTVATGAGTTDPGGIIVLTASGLDCVRMDGGVTSGDIAGDMATACEIGNCSDIEK